MSLQAYLRNVAIIAHVDHGKTTLVDQMLKQAGVFRDPSLVEERVMDSDVLERERGITILAKTTAIPYGQYTIQIVDTPGHADFGGEVERIMKMVDGVLLVVDAFEGCMPQTRFVLRRALEEKKIPIVVINKMDRPNARPAEVLDEVLDLFIDLGADETQLDFPVVYASALKGQASTSPEQMGEDLRALFDAIITHIPAPEGDGEAPLQLQVSLLDYNDYLGRLVIGRIARGQIRIGQPVVLLRRDGSKEPFRVTKLYGFRGLERVEITAAGVGEMVAVAGLDDVEVGETITDAECPEALPLPRVEEPTLQMAFLVNDSPFAEREGKHVTSRKLKERLLAETKVDVALRVEETDHPDVFLVSGRGELHLSILIEKMRREGYELQVSKPAVIFREEDGQLLEPFESLWIEVPEEYAGAVIESLGARKAEMRNMSQQDGLVRMEFLIPSRGLIGYRSQFLTLTRGYGILHHSFDSYRPAVEGEVRGRRNGALIAHSTGVATVYGIESAEQRGVMFITPGTEVYEGMIVGEHAREQDLVVNVCKEKHATNIRSSTKEETVKLKAPRLLSLEEALQFLNDDEYCEITPVSIRLRKKHLTRSAREKADKLRRKG
ncbi:MAG: GTP-binding protein TypA [Bacillus thermozeamaize]|uniref:Large ribosomal subunit assembly factor BipA n=1 Tax=Bacillus thermozeamaize TaxID=230954 RepID=A0A1Y3PNP4_9BACI|nr:MAG: GTP-binding protein TypA [Bacillus thermozeamaize]